MENTGRDAQGNLILYEVTPKFLAFEKAVLETIRRFDVNKLSAFEKQFEHLRAVNQKFTGCGFFTHYECTDKSLRVFDGDMGPFGGIAAKIEGLKHGASFALFAEDGFISFLEGYCYDEIWPRDILSYTLTCVNMDGTETPIVL